MTKKIGNIVVIEQTEPQVCEFCGEIRETRPYGKNGSNICYECGHKSENIEETNRRAHELIDSSERVILNL